jgi:glutathione synthase/RimK-type ligase-like ATP-grasp enzyme
MAIIVVVNHLKDFPENIPGVETVTAKNYLTNPHYSTIAAARVFNLCRSYSYQSTGYYISLLAMARGHNVLPDITTIQDTKTQSIIKIKSEELTEQIQKSLEGIEDKDFELDICFGKTFDNKFSAIGAQLFYQFQAPLLRAFFSRKKNKWKLMDVDPVSMKDIKANEQEFTITSAKAFFSNKRTNTKKQATYRFEMAILVNEDEEQPPSDKNAIKKFIKAAESLGIAAWTITKDEYNHLGEYDALFIRETTNVNHYTYRFSRRATVEGLVVYVDPESILRCSNKVYLAELLDRNNIPTPKTLVVHKDNLDEITKEFSFPVILKLPDSCFSKGVLKAKNKAELDEKSKEMLRQSDLIIVQEFLPTDYDWRVGIMDGKALYACKYYMAGKHWQIVDYEAKGNNKEGRHETFAVADAPKAIIDAALNAANLIGNGLYGVDLKEINGKPYIIEINDNPSIDSGVEDMVLKDDLYKQIMRVFLEKMEAVRAGKK